MSASPMPVAELTRWPRLLVAKAMGIARDNNWTVGLLVFLGVLLVFTKIINPFYGVTGVQGLANSVLPLALATTGRSGCWSSWACCSCSPRSSTRSTG